MDVFPSIKKQTQDEENEEDKFDEENKIKLNLAKIKKDIQKRNTVDNSGKKF